MSDKYPSISEGGGIIGCVEKRNCDSAGEGVLLSPSGLPGWDTADRLVVVNPEQNLRERVLPEKMYPGTGSSLTITEAQQAPVVATERLPPPRKSTEWSPVLATKMGITMSGKTCGARSFHTAPEKMYPGPEVAQLPGCKNGEVQESCINNTMKPNLRSGSPGRNAPDTDTKANPVGPVRVASSGSEAILAEAQVVHRDPGDEGEDPMDRLTQENHLDHNIEVEEQACRTSRDPSVNSLQEIRRGVMYQCQPTDNDLRGMRNAMALSEAAFVCRCRVDLNGVRLAACLDTGATFSLLSSRVYRSMQDQLPALAPPTLSLQGAGGESLDVEGVCKVNFVVDGETFPIEVFVGKLENLDLLLGMDWLCTYGVELDCGSRTIRIGLHEMQFGHQILAVGSKDLVSMDKTVRIRPRGVQRVSCHVRDLARVGQEVLIEGVVTLGDHMYVMPSLEIVREDGSIPLTIENQGTNYREIKKGLIVAKITDLPNQEEGCLDDADRTSDGGETPPTCKIWQIPTHVASVNAVGSRHGSEWTSQQFIPEGEGGKPSDASGGCKMYYAERKPDEGVAEPAAAESWGKIPEYLRCMLPAEGTLTPDNASKLEALVTEFEDIFLGPDEKLGYTDLISHKIDTGDALPIKQNYYRRSQKEREYVDAELEKMLASGVICPSKSPWGAPVVLVRKKTGELRFCIDFRRLNEVTKKDAYPLPRIDECLDALEGSKFFSTLDLASGYWQVAMDPCDAEKTAFVTHRGLYQWTVMPFGLCNAPGTFCRLMEMVLADIVWSQCLVYLDDILAFGRDFATAMLNLRAVFLRLRKANLKLKPKKCQLFATMVEYLGHEVDQDGIRPSRSKIQALHDWRPPINLQEVRTFLGFTGYYRRFVRNYSEMAKPLTELTKKGVVFDWTQDRQIAFELVKAALEEIPLLYYPQPNTDFHLRVDASLFAIGGTLEQEQGGRIVPLGFASKTLCKSRQSYCATKREFYAVVFFMRYFRDITRGTMVIIWTDHAALTWVQNYHQSDNMYMRWLVEMGWYKPWKIQHVAGKLNEVADALSRKRGIYPGMQEAFCKGKPCNLGECPDCLFHRKKLDRCRDPDSDDSDEVIEKPEEALGVAMVNFADFLNARWEFAARDVDSDDDGEEPELVDGIDFNVYLTRRLHDLPNRTRLDLREVEAGAAEVLAVEVPAVRRSARLAEKRRGAAVAARPLVQGEQESEGDADDEDGTDEVPVVGQPTVDAEAQCSRVLGHFTRDEWREAQSGDQCIRRVAELKQLWGKRCQAAALRQETPEVREYCRWWDNIYKDKGGIWRLRKTLSVRGKPDEKLNLPLVPVAWRESIWRCVHVHSVSHLGYERVYELLRRRFAWPGMWEDVKLMCRACVTCQQCKSGPGGGKNPMKHEYVGFPHERVGIDLQGPLPETSGGHKYICVIQDYFSKRMELYALERKTAEAVANVIFREYISRHGAMRKLHSDQGSEFDNQICLELCKLYGVDKSRTTSYAPWSNGMVERSNKTIKAILRALNVEQKDNWDEMLPYVFMAYNATPHATTGFSPQRLFYSQCTDPLLPVDLMYGFDDRNTPRCYASYVFHQRNLAMQTAEAVREVTGRAVAVQMEQREKGAMKPRQYNVGDMVLLFHPPNKRDVLHSQPWTGPHEIIEVGSDLVVRLKILIKENNEVRRGRKPQETKWVHTNHIKPFIAASGGVVNVVDSKDLFYSPRAARDRELRYYEYWRSNY